jgi:hypothetical protein
MSDSSKNNLKQTKLQYKYKVFFELGIDPYQAPIKKTRTYYTWSDVCHALSIHMGKEIDSTDEHIKHCGKWYVTNFGRAKIIQVIDYYEYVQDTEDDLQENMLSKLPKERLKDVRSSLKKCVDDAVSCIIS